MPVDQPERPDARREAAHQLRRLAHAFVDREIDQATLESIADEAGRRADALAGFLERCRPGDGMAFLLGEATLSEADDDARAAPADWESGVRMPFRDSFISGNQSPVSMGADVRLVGNQAIARVVFGRLWGGAPGRVHGGAVASVFDEVTGAVLGLLGTPAYTGHLDVAFHGAMPIGEEVDFVGRLHDRDGRKLSITAEATVTGEIVATCHALYIAVDLDKFSQAGQAETG